MTQTLGQFLLNDVLPKEHAVTEPLNKKALYTHLYELARKDPKIAADSINKLRELGHEIATTEGLTITLDDITPDPRAKPILRTALTAVKRTTNPKTKTDIIMRTQEKLLKQAPGHPGSQGMLVRSGSRGKPVQLMRTINAAVHAKDPVGRTYPWLIHHSYSEGLRPSEMWVDHTQSRNNIIESNLAVTEPGDLSKILVNNMSDQLVLSEDCGTKNGVMMSTSDPNAADRYLARAEGGFQANTLITPQVQTKLRRKLKNIMVRSPMTCELGEGVCQKCYGLNEYGNHQTLGTNVGMRSAQALTEPMTQFTISAKHGLGTARRAKQVSGLRALRQFLDIPKSFVNKAVVSTTDGKIDRIEKAPQGGHRIFVEDKMHYIPPGTNPVVRKGQSVTPGDVLSEGIPMPNEVVQYKGMGTGRKYLVDHLHDVYKDRGVDIDKRHLEILARSHLNHVRVEDDPENRFYPGEIVPYSTMLSHLAKDVRSVPVPKAKGELLAQGYAHYTAGTPVTPEIVQDLKKNKIETVLVSKRPPTLSFVMRPISRNPLLNPDWMARLGHRYLKESILEGAHFGQSSQLHGTHPIPAYVYGPEFGRGHRGKY
jgi:DNA-directed RNA polymerase subunit beta'